MAQTADLVVLQGGQLIHRASYAPGQLRDCFSMTKSVLAMLVGLAVDSGAVTLEECVEDDATVRDFLTMTRGVASDPEDIDRVMELPSGWEQAIRGRTRRWAPGTRFCYDNEAAHLLAIWLSRRVGDLEKYAAEHLFGPLGIDEAKWLRDPEGYCFGAAHLQLSAGSLATLGQLLLDGGTTSTRRVLSSSWVQAMTTAWTPGGPPENTGYGYLTWVADDGFFFGGWAGQHTSVFPAYDLVVVTTGLPSLLPADWTPARAAVPAHLASAPSCSAYPLRLGRRPGRAALTSAGPSTPDMGA
ncbi:CubicO group peptidase, beta-lactamase class C family [Actinopolymorpha cephalotaxi]|uniref:CubicO group peptidase (Beta-lactamase class C family) n=1 Tax=Actinopolymorpha cephalotaxi TaxID=504797 RepID=A0A1I2KCY9_9ACTN|nr:serine hydrolase [Actinopolymorpha cephalotaxi]NYH87347.1 CubicO group peptidase (beta-lactamase class C family) [Actinopolymorpha cephalotaxi]SFF64922.1 CubicO group peptidase, beta-lactamase class C family [Actinopolymorpha cephalotaxi]